MNAPHVSTKSALSRRSFLRGTGAVLALPWLEAMVPAFATRAQAAAATSAPMRFVAMNYGLGFHGPFLFPEQSGADYQPTPYLEIIDRHRRDFTLISGLSHIEQNGANGHSSTATWLTAAKRPLLPGFKNTISIDQLLVEKLQPNTRFPCLTLSAEGNNSLSWTANGVNIPAESSPSHLFEELFVTGSKQEVAGQLRELRRGKSILDTVRGEARKLHGTLGKQDQEKFDQYLTSVRDLEHRLQQNEAWVEKPKPEVEMAPPKDVSDRFDIIGKTRLMHQLIVLALQTDSTRIITYSAGGFNPVPTIEGVSTGWHDLSHHGQDEEKIDELAIIEKAEFREIDRLLTMLKEAQDAHGPVLDHTQLLIGSNLGNASGHHWRNLPLILAGGGYQHGQHLVAGGQDLDNARFCNLFVQMAQRMNAPIDSFATSDGTSVKGLS